ncbi:hypothetical protein KY285_033348 [Solanum tuberosum]|nr:hypothetical protein KY285_033348 [Solanum tuberosum]
MHGMKWIEGVDTTRHAMVILGRRLNTIDDKFKTLEDFTLEKNDNIRKKLEAPGGAVTSNGDREAKIEAPKPPMLKGVRDTPECNKVKSDENKINNVVLYLLVMAMLWWSCKESEIGKGLCTINTLERFREEFKKTLFPNNIIYEAKHKFRELKQTDNIRAYVKKFTILTLQIPNLTDEDMLFPFMNELRN